MDHYVGTIDLLLVHGFRLACILVGVVFDFVLQKPTFMRLAMLFLYFYNVAAAINALFEFDEVEGIWGAFFRKLFARRYWRSQRAAYPFRRPLSRAKQRKMSRVDALPAVVYLTGEELNALSEEELKSLVERTSWAGAAIPEGLSQQELVERIPHRTQFTETECIICREDFKSGEDLRGLVCGHLFHARCIGQWFAKRVEQSRPVTCPICNADAIARNT